VPGGCPGIECAGSVRARSVRAGQVCAAPACAAPACAGLQRDDPVTAGQQSILARMPANRYHRSRRGSAANEAGSGGRRPTMCRARPVEPAAGCPSPLGWKEAREEAHCAE